MSDDHADDPEQVTSQFGGIACDSKSERRRFQLYLKVSFDS